MASYNECWSESRLQWPWSPNDSASPHPHQGSPVKDLTWLHSFPGPASYNTASPLVSRSRRMHGVHSIQMYSASCLGHSSRRLHSYKEYDRRHLKFSRFSSTVRSKIVPSDLDILKLQQQKQEALVFSPQYSSKAALKHPEAACPSTHPTSL